jgi:hypothetical protein
MHHSNTWLLSLLLLLLLLLLGRAKRGELLEGQGADAAGPASCSYSHAYAIAGGCYMECSWPTAAHQMGLLPTAQEQTHGNQTNPSGPTKCHHPHRIQLPYARLVSHHTKGFTVPPSQCWGPGGPREQVACLLSLAPGKTSHSCLGEGYT